MADDTERLLIETQANNDQAEAAFAHLADSIDALPQDPTITPDAQTTTAADALSKLEENAKQVDGTKVTVTAEADTTEAEGNLSKFSDHAASRGEEAGKRFGGQFVGDVGGAISQGPEQQALNGFAQALETGLGAAGIGDAVAGPIIAAFGVGSVAILAVKALWDAFHSGAKQAQQDVQDVKDIQDKVAAGQFEQAGKAFGDKYRDAFKAAKDAGVSAYEATKYITGQGSAAIDAVIAANNAKIAAAKASGPYGAAEIIQLDAINAKLEDAKAGYEKGGDAAAYQADQVSDIGKALGGIPQSTDKYVNIYVQDSSLQAALARLQQVQKYGVDFFGSASAPPAAGTASSAAQSATAAKNLRDYNRRNGSVAI